MNEIWKPIKGYEGFYEVSNLGRVRSLDRLVIRHKHTVNREGKESHEHMMKCKGNELKARVNNSGYLYVALHRDGKEKTQRIHRLVAEAFIDNPNNFPQVNHIDEDKLNNRSDNLEWCDCKYNVNYGSRLGAMRGVNNPTAKLTEKDVLEIRRRRADGALLKDIAEEFGVSESLISLTANGKNWGWLT